MLRPATVHGIKARTPFTPQRGVVRNVWNGGRCRFRRYPARVYRGSRNAESQLPAPPHAP